MEVRRANRNDLPGITGLLYGDYFRDMSALLSPPSITALVENDFSPTALKRRILEGSLVIAEDEGHLLGFALAGLAGDHIELRSICTKAEYQHQGVAKRLLDEIQVIDATLPISATVLLGNLPAESFHESQGFAPGEIVEREVAGQQIVERRWWRSPEGS